MPSASCMYAVRVFVGLVMLALSVGLLAPVADAMKLKPSPSLPRGSGTCVYVDPSDPPYVVYMTTDC